MIMMIQCAHIVKIQGNAAVAMVVAIWQGWIRIDLALYVKVQENAYTVEEIVETPVTVVMMMMIKNSVLHVTALAFAHDATVRALL